MARSKTPKDPSPPETVDTGMTTSQSASSLKKRRKPTPSFKLHIHRLLKSSQPDMAISQKAMSVMHSFLLDLFDRLAKEAVSLATANKKATVSAREIQTAVRLVLGGDLATHAISEGMRAILKYHGEDEKVAKKNDQVARAF